MSTHYLHSADFTPAAEPAAGPAAEPDAAVAEPDAPVAGPAAEPDAPVAEPDAAVAGPAAEPDAPVAEPDAPVAPAGETRDARRAPVGWIALIAAAAFATEMAVSARYGYVRDELYFLSAGRHLAFGYVDQPPLTPLLARLSAAASGDSLVALRLIPALVLAGMIALTAYMSRLLGAGRTGQVLTALATATCAEYLGAMHELTTTVPDFFFWTVTLVLVLKLLTTGNRRWWVAIGLCLGVAAEAKWNIGFLVGALAVGFALTPARRLAASWWLALGGLIAVGLALPDLVWQAANGWPAFDVFAGLQQDAGHNRAVYLIAQLIYTGLVLAPIWIAGLAWLLRNPAARRFRAIGIAGLVVLALFLVTGGKPYYPGGIFTVLLAAGSVPLEGWLARRRPLARRARPAVVMGSAMVVLSLITLPTLLPILPARALHYVPVQKLNYDLGEEIAWPKLVGLVAREYHALPPALRSRTTVITSNYGESGAIERFGPADGLPAAYSGNNNFWLWGPPPARDTAALVVGMDPAFLRREFRHVRLVATFENGIGVSDDEQGAPIYLATGLRSSWARAWPAFRDYA